MPQLQRLLELPEARTLLRQAPREAVVAALRAALDEARKALRLDPDAPAPGGPALIGAAAGRIGRPGSLVRVINATGIVLHTNLGRAPLAEPALAAIEELARGYSSLELDLASGRRGARAPGVTDLLCQLTGAEAALVVNNAAAAVLLGLSGLAGGLAGGAAGGGEVIVSRGELVEIGGGFRIPDVIQQGGATLVEVGTTNRTRLDDYARAITPRTRMLLKVHQSNYRITGFTEAAGLPELAALARAHGLVLMQDLGSGAMLDLASIGLPHEPTAGGSLKAGADLVAFSADKLLGGPQGGILVGSEAAVAPLRRHPLLRALRADKLSLAALEATLRLYRDPAEARAAVPVLRMLGQPPEALEARAHRLLRLLDGNLAAELVASSGRAGGGTLPGFEIESRAVAIGDGGDLAARLRAGAPAVLGRLAGGRLLLDMLAVSDEEILALAEALRAASRA